MPRSTEALLARLLAALEGELPAAVELRWQLHAEPELAHAEEQTARRVVERLPVPAATAASSRFVQAGAATVDITPPPPSAGTEPVGCLPVDGRGPFTGPHKFGVEEP